MSIKVSKLFGEISQEELQKISEQYNNMSKRISDFQHRPTTQDNGHKRSPKIKGYTLIYR